MKLGADRLGQQLKGALARLYLISGDEPLLCQEAVDAVRSAASAQGFNERLAFNAERDFDWGQLARAGDNLSLFAEKQLFELRLPSGKPGDQGAAALLHYLEQDQDSSLLLLSLPKLDKASLSSKWFKTLQQHPQAVVVQIWPVEEAALPQWLRVRLAKAGLKASDDAIEVICSRVEGNLLAASQEVEKLRLLATEGQTIDADFAQCAVAQSARFNLFGLLDTALSGQAAQALRMVQGLRSEGVEAPVILWGLARELRLLASIAELQAQGLPLAQAMARQRPPVWEKRRPLLNRALQRQRPEHWQRLLLQAQAIDEQIKGQLPGSVWPGLNHLVLGLAGKAAGASRAD